MMKHKTIRLILGNNMFLNYICCQLWQQQF